MPRRPAGRRRPRDRPSAGRGSPEAGRRPPGRSPSVSHRFPAPSGWGAQRPQGKGKRDPPSLVPPAPPAISPMKHGRVLFFFFYKMYSSSLELKNKSMYKTGRDQAPLTHSQTPADFLRSPLRRAGPRGGSQRVGKRSALIWSQFGQEGGASQDSQAGGCVSCPRLAGQRREEARISKL